MRHWKPVAGPHLATRLSESQHLPGSLSSTAESTDPVRSHTKTRVGPTKKLHIPHFYMQVSTMKMTMTTQNIY